MSRLRGASVAASTHAITRARARDDYVETLVHDLAQALSSIVLRVELAERSLGAADAADGTRKHLQVIRADAQRLHDQMTRLLEEARIEADAFPIEQSPSDLRALVAECAGQLDPEGKRLALDIGTTPVMASIDRAQMKRVVLNLIDNALKYSSGRVDIKLRGLENEALLVVGDHGAGIDTDEIAHIFDRFYRSPRLAMLAAGSGLGLYGCRRIVEGHGGQLLAESAGPGQGSRFSVILPAPQAGQ